MFKKYYQQFKKEEIPVKGLFIKNPLNPKCEEHFKEITKYTCKNDKVFG